MFDVLVLGAGLGGLSAARDLVRAGVSVKVLEARDRVGGRTLQTELADGRTIQLGGELVGTTHTSYVGLVEELGLALRDSYISEPGETVWDLDGRVSVGDPAPWMSATDHEDYARIVQQLVGLAKTVDADDPWSHPDAAQLDATSFQAWLEEAGARPAVVRMFQAGKASLAGDQPAFTSTLAELRKFAVAGEELTDYYDVDQWTRFTVAEGSASVSLTMGRELAEHLELGAVVTAIDVAPERVRITLADGRIFEGRSVVCALPVGPLRRVAIDGLSPERLNALRRIRHSLTAKVVTAYETPFWRDIGQNGLAYSDGIMGATWAQTQGVLSGLVAPERLAFYLASDPARREDLLRAQLVRLYGEGAADPVALHTRDWFQDEHTLGYMAHYGPGDLTSIGPLHAQPEPPFYVAGSDFWVAGYMEGAVRTGRQAAAAILAR